MKEIVALAHDDAGQDARLKTAVDIVRAVHGHLTCIDVAMVADPMIDHCLALTVQERSAERHNRSQVRHRLDGEQVEYDWIDAAGDPASAIAAVGGLADLVVISSLLQDDEWPDMLTLARALVGRLRSPLLAVPQACSGFQAGKPATVLWDGSNDAEAALAAAVPLLRLASDVRVLEFRNEPHGSSTNRAIAYLEHHEVVAHASRHETFGSVAETIERLLHRHPPGLVVMGAFGHGRLHDGVFGSVTSHLFAKTSSPLLMAHA